MSTQHKTIIGWSHGITRFCDQTDTLHAITEESLALCGCKPPMGFGGLFHDPAGVGSPCQACQRIASKSKKAGKS